MDLFGLESNHVQIQYVVIDPLAYLTSWNQNSSDIESQEIKNQENWKSFGPNNMSIKKRTI